MRLKWTGSFPVSIQGVGNFTTGTEHSVSEEIARSFNGEEGWEVSDDSPPKKAAEAVKGGAKVEQPI